MADGPQAVVSAADALDDIIDRYRAEVHRYIAVFSDGETPTPVEPITQAALDSLAQYREDIAAAERRLIDAQHRILGDI